MRVTIRQMQILDAVARAGSVVGAAAALHISPAAASLALRELENAIGFRVMERTTRRLALTRNGLGYLGYVRKILSEIDGAQRFAVDVRQGRQVVRIATTQTLLSCLLPAAFCRIQARWPDLYIDALDVAAGEIGEALARRQADLAIGVDLPDDDRFECRRLYASPWIAFASPLHPLGGQEAVTWQALSVHRLYMTRTSTFKLAAQLGSQQGLRDTQEASTASAGLAMASTGQGIAVFPGYAQPLAQVMGLRALQIRDPSLTHVLGVGVPREVESTSTVHALRDLLIEVLLPMSTET